MSLFTPLNMLLGLLNLALLVLVAWALIDAAIRPAAAFVAAGKQTKVIWLAILGVGLLVTLAGSGLLGFFGFIVAVAAIVYLVDVRPAVRGGG